VCAAPGSLFPCLTLSDMQGVCPASVVCVALQASALPTVPEVKQEQSAAAFEARWTAYVQEAAKLSLVFGAHAADRKPIHHRQVGAHQWHPAGHQPHQPKLDLLLLCATIHRQMDLHRCSCPAGFC
jgi:hypothetical protein